MKLTIIPMALLLVSSVTHAAAIESIKVFHTDKVRVVQDIPLNGYQNIEVFNMDTKNNATFKLNTLMKKKVQSKSRITDHKAAYLEAFDEVLNSSNWDEIYLGFEKGGLAIVSAVQLKIKKTPAIVFNETSVVYGVTSLREAVQIYNKSNKK